MRAHAWVALLVSLLAVTPAAADPPRDPARRRVSPRSLRAPAYADGSWVTLAWADGFELGGGPEDTRSVPERLARLLARRPDAVAWFDRIARDGKPGGRLYAYWALRALAPAVARRHRARLLADPAPVRVAPLGCLEGLRSTVAAQAAAIEAQPPPRLRP